MPSVLDFILPQDHFTKNFFVWDSFTDQLTTIVCKKEKSEIKKQQYPVHKIVLLNPGKIISKETVHFSILICMYVDIQLIEIHPYISILIYFICKNKNTR